MVLRSQTAPNPKVWDTALAAVARQILARLFVCLNVGRLMWHGQARAGRYTTSRVSIVIPTGDDMTEVGQ